MDKEKCSICQTLFNDSKDFLKHLRVHKITYAEYYQTYIPKHDLHTGDIILFKNREFYLNSDFNNKNNLRYWLNKQTPQVAKDYCLEILSRRKRTKNLIYTPTQVELRSVMIPSVNYLHNLFGDYYKTCESLGFKNKFSYIKCLPDCELKDNNKIIIDTREKKPLIFKSIKSEVGTLKFGDYSMANGSDDSFNDLVFERKSLNDLFNTLSKGFERFKREIEKSVEAKKYMIVIVENKYEDVYKIKYLNDVFSKIKATPDYIMHNIRDLIQTYDNIQFLFVQGRKECVRVMEKIYASGDAYKKYDMQLLYDMKGL